MRSSKLWSRLQNSANTQLLQVFAGLVLTVGASGTVYLYKAAHGFQAQLERGDAALSAGRFDLAAHTYRHAAIATGGAAPAVLRLAELHRETGNATAELAVRCDLVMRRIELLRSGELGFEPVAQLRRIRELQDALPAAERQAELVEQCRSAAVMQAALSELQK